MFWLGVNDPDSQLHAADFSPDEAALVPGVTAVVHFLEHRMLEKCKPAQIIISSYIKTERELARVETGT